MSASKDHPRAFQVSGVHAGYGKGRPILRGVDVDIPAGQITAIIGANGCGKSTLLKTLATIVKPEAGEITVAGRALKDYSRQELARRVSLLPQTPVAPEGLTVRELVRFGRQPHYGLIARHSSADEEAVTSALQAANVELLAEEPLESLSGGQRQRAWIAMSLAQQSDIVLFDEPTTYLDIQNQTEVLRLVHRLNQEEGRTIVMVLHDLNQAARYAHHLIAMTKGEVVAAGAPETLLTAELIQQVFGIECSVVPNPLDGTPLCLPHD